MPDTPPLTTAAALAETLTELVGSGALPAPCLVSTTAHDLSIKPIEGVHPLDAVVGLVALESWRTFGVVTDASYRSVDAPPGSGTSPPAPGPGASDEPGAGRAVLVHVVDRGGTSHSVLCGRDQPVVESSASGPLADACRRVFGLPTAPCPPSDELWAFLWLDAVVAAAVGGELPKRNQWRAIAALHPFARLVNLDLRSTTGSLSVNELTDWGTKLSAYLPWPALRQRALAGTLPVVPELSRAQLQWFDDGSFARFVMAAYPHWRDLRGDLAPLIGPTTLARLDDVLSSWNLSPHHGA